MEANKAGVVTPTGTGEGVDEGTKTGDQDGGQHSQHGNGTGDAAKSHADKPEGQDGDGAGADGAGAGDGTGDGGDGEGAKHDPKDKRINDLMSNWQSEEASHNKTKSKLQLYEEKFGPLDTDGKPAPKAKPKANVAIPEDDQEMPESMKPGWSPKTMEELQEGLRQTALYGARLAQRDIKAEAMTRKEAEQQLDNFVTEIKAVDSEFDDKVFFQYAADHGFSVNSVADLRAVYKSYVTLERAKRGAVEAALKNKDQRKNPVNKPGSGQGNSGAVPFSKISQATSAKDLISDMLSNRK